MDELAELAARVAKQVTEQATVHAMTLDNIALGFEHVAADLAAAGIDASQTRTYADHLHGLALMYRVGSPS